jgi:hypothetical protein
MVDFCVAVGCYAKLAFHLPLSLPAGLRIAADPERVKYYPDTGTDARFRHHG